MNSSSDFDFPSTYQEERTHEGVRFILPHRQLGKIRLVGWAIMGVGVFVILLAAKWTAAWMIGGWQLVQQGAKWGWLLSAVGLVAFLPAKRFLQIFSAGLALLRNRTYSEIEIGNSGVHSVERFSRSALKWKVTDSTSAITKLRVAAARLGSSELDSSAFNRLMASGGSALFAEMDGRDKPRIIAACYPRPMLLKLAKEMSQHLPNAIVDESEEPIRIGEEEFLTTRPVRVTQAPDECEIEIDRRSEGTAFRVPAAGLKKGSKGLLYFSIIWNTFVSVILVFLIMMTIKEPAFSLIYFALFMIPFVAIGIWSAYSTVKMGWRKTAVVTAGQRVMVITESPFGKETRNWHIDELKRICVGRSGMAINDVPVMELQFLTPEGKFGILSERPNDQLDWLAGQVNLELGLIDNADAGNDEFALAGVSHE